MRIAFRLNRIFAFAAQSVPDSLAENFMSMLSKVTMAGETGFLSHYLESLSLVERLHRLLLDVIKDEF